MSLGTAKNRTKKTSTNKTKEKREKSEEPAVVAGKPTVHNESDTANKLTKIEEPSPSDKRKKAWHKRKGGAQGCCGEGKENKKGKSKDAVISDESDKMDGRTPTTAIEKVKET